MFCRTIQYRDSNLPMFYRFSIFCARRSAVLKSELFSLVILQDCTSFLFPFVPLLSLSYSSNYRLYACTDFHLGLISTQQQSGCFALSSCDSFGVVLISEMADSRNWTRLCPLFGCCLRFATPNFSCGTWNFSCWVNSLSLVCFTICYVMHLIRRNVSARFLVQFHYSEALPFVGLLYLGDAS